MGNALFDNNNEITVRALFIGQRIDLRTFGQDQSLATAPLLLAAGKHGCAVLFRYGVVVLFGLTGEEETEFLAKLWPMVHEPLESIEVQEETIVIAENSEEGIQQSKIIVKNFDYIRLQLTAEILAKSVVLSHYETQLASTFDRIDPLAAELQRGGRGVKQSRGLLRHIGTSLSILGKMVGRVEVDEKPEILWENPELERLYLRLEDEYEIHERHVALERKLDLISRTAETLLSLLHNRRSLRVEWYIVILILVEIVILVYEML